MFCNYCGKKNVKNFVYCSYCGKKRTTGIANGKKSIKSKTTVEQKFKSEEIVGKLKLNDNFYVTVRFLTFFDKPGTYVDIRKTSTTAAKLKGLSFSKQFLPDLYKVLETMAYDTKKDLLLLDKDIIDNMVYEDITLDNGDKLSSSEIGKINIDENHYIMFKLLIYDDGNRYIDIRKTKKDDNKRLQGLSIPINKINEFKILIYNLES